MRYALAVLVAVLAGPMAASADLTCRDWNGLGPEQRQATVQQMIEGHLSSEKSQRYTSANRVAMKRCLERLAGRIMDDFDEVCSQKRTASMGAIDEVFDKYLISCVQ
jgi:hypothetical protein